MIFLKMLQYLVKHVTFGFLGDEISGISVRERDDVVRVSYIYMCVLLFPR